ncbi:DUF2950 family protein [Devosia sp. ZB163]|uniref:DUF2950 family protein n=1 Tax=Devosia sp. ZB163 TaxID=3025938 RepID=UPI00235E36A5|nr:DUF2950 family protein [Devosia sp. ZB163]MDC9824655.1 DUF2950 family protein [Devosia sp. ZB163]
MSTTNRMTFTCSLLGASLLALALASPGLAQTDQPAQTDQTGSTDQSGPADQPGLADFAADEDPPAFDQPAQAVDAFKAALASNDFDGLAKLLGLDAAKLRTQDGAMDTFNQMRDAAAKRVHVDDKPNLQIIELGKQLWPLPFPLVKGDDGKWAFDTYAGIDEIIDRRVGENEIETVATLRALADAEDEYMTLDRDGDGVLEYAQKLISTPGTMDGLYWPEDQGDGESPAAEIPDESEMAKARNDEGYYGYRYRILTGQGANIIGGKQDYLVNGNLTGGFAIVAWPVTYAETGVSTFLVNKDGIVYETDLGPQTAEKVKGINDFNPDDTWELAKD